MAQIADAQHCQIPFSNEQKLEKIAQDLLDKEGLAGKFYPKERDFVMAASRLVMKVIENFYSASGGQPPTLSTVRAWFYRDCPDWAIAVLANQVQQK
ncbi:MAG: hypothetical protein V7K76_22835 [Nostoc sp.]|uniref:hypothetical protein n=1 Tax=Nostoc sp. TaxID=1180 RepID=UPI002FF4E284